VEFDRVSDVFLIRAAQPDDAVVLFDLVRALAEYERRSEEVVGSSDALRDHLFGSTPCVEALVAVCDGRTVGFALFFSTYSTFLTARGIHLEDIFVLPDFRGRGVGKALLGKVADLAVSRGAGRLEWTVLDWNTSAIEFYRRRGAEVLPDWRVCRVTGDALGALARG